MPAFLGSESDRSRVPGSLRIRHPGRLPEPCRSALLAMPPMPRINDFLEGSCRCARRFSRAVSPIRRGIYPSPTTWDCASLLRAQMRFLRTSIYGSRPEDNRPRASNDRLDEDINRTRVNVPSIFTTVSLSLSLSLSVSVSLARSLFF